LDALSLMGNCNHEEIEQSLDSMKVINFVTKSVT